MTEIADPVTRAKEIIEEIAAVSAREGLSERKLAEAQKVRSNEKRDNAIAIDKLRAELNELKEAHARTVRQVAYVFSDPSVPVAEKLRLKNDVVRMAEIHQDHMLVRQLGAAITEITRKKIESEGQRDRILKSIDEDRMPDELLAQPPIVYVVNDPNWIDQDGIHREIDLGRLELRRPPACSEDEFASAVTELRRLVATARSQFIR
jgi:hypothetical protein